MTAVVHAHLALVVRFLYEGYLRRTNGDGELKA